MNKHLYDKNKNTSLTCLHLAHTITIYKRPHSSKTIIYIFLKNPKPSENIHINGVGNWNMDLHNPPSACWRLQTSLPQNFFIKLHSHLISSRAPTRIIAAIVAYAKHKQIKIWITASLWQIIITIFLKI